MTVDREHSSKTGLSNLNKLTNPFPCRGETLTTRVINSVAVLHFAMAVVKRLLECREQCS